MASPKVEEYAKGIVQQMKFLNAFPNGDYMDRIFNKVRRIPLFSSTFELQSNGHTVGSDPNSTLLDGIDQKALLTELGVHTVVSSISALDNGTDKGKFRTTIKGTPAEEGIIDVLVNLSASIFAEHINDHLATKGLPELPELARVQGLGDRLAGLLKDENFVSLNLAGDLARGDHWYSLSLLFICDYLHKGPGFTPAFGQDFIAAPSYEVLGSWSAELLNLGTMSAEDVLAITTQLASAVAANTFKGVAGKKAQIPNMMTLKPLVFQTSFKEGVQQAKNMRSNHGFQRHPNQASLDDDTIDGLKDAALHEFESISSTGIAIWTSTIKNQWIKAVSTRAMQSSQSARKITKYEMVPFSTLGTTIPVEYWETTTTTGKVLADWVVSQSKGQFASDFTGKSPDVPRSVKREKVLQSPASCFIAGTMVKTDSGDVAIETISEGMRILTDANFQRFGIASDEEVEVDLPEPLLVGFNNEGTFSTPGHVFHTTTGLRAVEPQLAMAENAWMDVGRLSEGHILYRLSEDGKSYDLVPITSIQVQRAEAQPVYGIHLREGERSYHANGYLVSVNYPEITIKSVARALKALPRKQRADMLVKIKELAPVFSKLGIQGVSDLLSREIRQNIKKKRNFTGPRRRKGYRGINFLDLKRTYALEAKDAPKTNKEGPPGYTLPQVSVYEGSLVVDDDVVPRATLDGSNGTIQWSRELPDFGYEHGMMEFDPTSVGTVGRGAVLVSEASDPEWDADSLRQVVPFTFEKSMRTNPVPRMTKTAQTLESRVPTFPIIDNDEDDSITDVDWWHVSVDSVPWSTDEGEDKTEFTAPWSFGNVGVGLYHSRPTNGVVVPVVLFKRLDDLRDKINATRLEDEKLGPLYNQEFSINSEGNWVGRVMFKRAGELAFLSDQYTGNPGGFPDTPPTERLTYRNFGYPYRIQHLFSLCEWEWSWDNRTLRGAMYKFDPAMREELGDKYYFASTPDATVREAQAMPLTRAELSLRAVTSPVGGVPRLSIAAESGPSTATSGIPASVTSRLLQASPLSVSTLWNLPGYREDDVHERSQDLVYETMLYHMDSDDRLNFINVPKPQGLPNELRDNLDDELITWIKDTYSRAYVAYMISQIEPRPGAPPETEPRVKLTADEKKKAWYFFRGKGPKCLARAPEYTKLNELAAVYAMRSLYAKDNSGTANDGPLLPFLQSPEGPEYWAHALYCAIVPCAEHEDEEIDTGYLLSKLVTEVIEGGENKLTQRCNVLHALAPFSSKAYANDLFKAIMAEVLNKLNQSTPTSLDDITLGLENEDESSDWVKDVMAILIDEVLNVNSTLGGAVMEDLRADLAQLAHDLGEDIGDNLETASELIMDSAASFVTHARFYFAGLGTSVSGLYSWIKGWSCWSLLCDQAGDDLLSGPASGETTKARVSVYKKLMMITLAAGIGVTAWQTVVNWKELDPSSRGAAVASLLQQTLITLTDGYKMWKDIRDYDDDATSRQRTSSLSGSSLNDLSSEVNSRASSRSSLGSFLEFEGDLDFDQNLRQLVAEKADEEARKIRPVDSRPNNNRPLSSTIDGDDVSFWKKFNTRLNWAETFAWGLGLAVGICLAWSLADNWENLDKWGRIASTVEVLTTILSSVVEAILFVGVDILAKTTWMFTTFLPAVGAVLALIGLILMIYFIFKGFDHTVEIPKDPFEVFVEEQAKPLLEGFDLPPVPKLTFTRDPVTPHASGSQTYFRIRARNLTGEPVTFDRITFSVYGGSKDNCLVTAKELKDWETLPAGEPLPTNSVAVMPMADWPGPPFDSLKAFTQTNPVSDSVTSYLTDVHGEITDENVNGALTLEHNEGFEVVYRSVINPPGAGENDLGKSFLEMVEYQTAVNGDTALTKMDVQRS